MRKELKTLGSIALSAVWHSEKNASRSDRNVEELLSETGYSAKGIAFAGIYSMAMKPYHKHFK